eukprot:SAG11_NODE_3848_length_2192_cov_1.253703_2_plen_231_part_00
MRAFRSLWCNTAPAQTPDEESICLFVLTSRHGAHHFRAPWAEAQRWVQCLRAALTHAGLRQSPSRASDGGHGGAATPCSSSEAAPHVGTPTHSPMGSPQRTPICSPRRSPAAWAPTATKQQLNNVPPGALSTALTAPAPADSSTPDALPREQSGSGGVGHGAFEAPAWTPDEEAWCCETPSCAKPFSLWLRRHHCRRCGGVFCGGAYHILTNVPAPLAARSCITALARVI